jgi:alkaline phosphatase
MANSHRLLQVSMTSGQQDVTHSGTAGLSPLHFEVMMHPFRVSMMGIFCLQLSIAATHAETHIRIMPPDRGVLAAGQRFDIRVEAWSDDATRPEGLRVRLNGNDLTARGDRSANEGAPSNSANFLLRGYSITSPGRVAIEAETADGARARVELTVEPWNAPRAGAPRAKNIILLLGDGMGIAHRTAARIVSRGVRNGKALGRLAMDTLDVTGMVMTSSLNAVITDSSPGMAAYSTGHKNANGQSGVFPDNTADPFDNPRIEYIGEILRRVRGPGFNVGIVTTADLTDSTPAANAAHTGDRYAAAGIAAQFLDERKTNGVTVLLGGGSRHFMPKGSGGERADDRQLAEEFSRAGYVRATNASDVKALLAAPKPARALLGLFHPSHMVVAFDKVGAGRYSDELADPRNAAYRDTPMLEDLARLALRTLEAHSPSGFYLMIEGASIDKRAHAADAERTVWDTIEFDRAVQAALEFARRTNSDKDPANDTLVIVTADHETGGLGLVSVGNELYAPQVIGRAVRDYAAVRFQSTDAINLYPNYEPDAQGYPRNPDPTRKLLLGWSSAADRYENWLANRTQEEAAVRSREQKTVVVANPERDGEKEKVPGFLVEGIVENGATACPTEHCPADTAATGQTSAGHTASDVPLSASGPGAWQFTGVYENTDVLLKMLRAATGSYPKGPQ